MTDDLGDALRALASEFRYPPTPDMTGDVIARVRRAPTPVPASSPSRLRFALAAAVVLAIALIAAVGLSPSARRAVAGWLGVEGISITFDESPPQEPIGADVFLGEPASAEEAAAAVDFDIAVPAELGEPDAYFVMRRVEGGEVSLVWEPAPGLPESEQTDVGAVFTQFIGRAQPEVIKKTAAGGTFVRQVTVDGGEGFFIDGAPHLVVREPDGDQRDIVPRLAGNTLLWEAGELTYRLEAHVGIRRAVEIAESVVVSRN